MVSLRILQPNRINLSQERHGEENHAGRSSFRVECQFWSNMAGSFWYTSGQSRV
jgi:hypothetical protein